MPDKSQSSDKKQTPEFTTDFLGEDRHELVAKLAYELWTKRGRPLGSPDVDWFAAEQAVYASLAAAGMISPASNDPQRMTDKIYQ